MPLLIGGLFNKRNRSSSSKHAPDSNRASTDHDDVLPNKSVPVYNLPAAASSSKFRLPFRRRAHNLSPPVDPPSHSYISSVTSDPGHDLSPPPRKSSLFGINNESLPSFHSLPNHSSSTNTPLDKKTPGLLSWARERTKSKPSQPSPTHSSLEDESFQLKSFRHISTNPSPEMSPPPSSDPLLPPARPRPRGDSVASDSSQRISVAAFREAQARSRANSPGPSLRPPSTADTLRVDGNGRNRTSTLSVVSAAASSQPNKNATSPPIHAHRPGSSPDSSSEDSESDDDEEVDSDGVPIPQKSTPVRKQTITRRAVGPRARSDLGHTIASTSRQEPPRFAPPPTNQSDQAPYARRRASYSTSALTPIDTARKASGLAGTRSPSSSHAHPVRPMRNSKDDSDQSSDTDSEDMLLSDLVAPRRPGSSTSNHSNSRPRMPPKPLIDIKSLAGGPPLLTPILRHEHSLKNLNTKHKEQDAEKDQPFSVPAVLVHSSSASPSISPSASKPDATSIYNPASSAHHRRSTTDVPAPKVPENDEDLMNAIRLVGALEKEKEGDHPSEASKPSVTSPSDHIVPTPIRSREPPISFTVLSRPPQRRSTADTSLSLSPAWQTPPKSAPPALSPQPETGTRPRAATISLVQNDKSDALSVSSAARSSRSSSRISPVPLIHSIPDSPSVKEEYKTGRPRTSSRISAANPVDARQTGVPPLPSGKVPSQAFQPSLMPQPPFANNRPTRGQSPVGSSTGDSSSGRAPFTPGDGSEIGVKSRDDASDVGSTLKARGHAKKPSVTFEDSRQPVRGRERSKTELTPEEKTRERRRSEAKAAIELGKIVNRRGPMLHDDSDEDMRPGGRNPTINVTMDPSAYGMMPGWGAWQQPVGAGMAPPQFNNDPAFLAAHQRALLVAKQAYQMAVAQHAMQMAGEEWERSSNAGFGSGGGSVYGGGGSVYGGGSGGSVYGGGSGGSVYGGMGGGMGPVGMMSMPNMGMLMPPGQWGRSSVAFPSAAASVYGGISSSQSEYGGGGGWGTRSVYGESFGPPPTPSRGGGGAPSSSASAYGGGPRPRARTGVSSQASATSQPMRMPDKNPPHRRVAPPSSWKNVR